MSIKDRIEAAKEDSNKKDDAFAARIEESKNENRRFFAPVYEAFKEIEQEYGTGRGVSIFVSDYRCEIKKETSRDKLVLMCVSLNLKPDIHIEERCDYSAVPDGGVERHEKDVETAEEAIEIAIQYVGKNVND